MEHDRRGAVRGWCAALALLAIAGALAAGAAEDVATDTEVVEDLWTGKPREAVEALLGEPDSVKEGRDGETTLVYKLHRLAEGAAAGEGVRVVLRLPDVGLVGRVADRRSRAETLTIEPSSVDRRGRSVAGGVTRTETQSASVEVGPDGQRKVERDPPVAATPPVHGKVKLTFHVGADGIVQRWDAGKPR